MPTNQNPYAYDLSTDFTNTTGKNTYSGGNGKFGPITYDVANYDTSNSQDSDVRSAQRIYNELEEAHAGRNQGLDQAAAGSQLNMLRSRIALKNALGQSISDNPGMEERAETDVRNVADNSLRSGLKKTKENYNRRGLLYSGYREGGESKVRSGVASQLASGLSGTKKDYATAADTAKAAYASVGLQTEQENLNRVGQAFDTANSNSIARMQAMQELGGGLGAAAGYIAGSGTTSTTPMSPNSYAPLETAKYSQYSVAPGLLSRGF